MDPFSLTTGVVGLLAVVAQITESINLYITALQERKQDLEDLYQELLLLRNVLLQLRDFVASETAKNASFDSASVLGTAISDCSRRLERVGDKLKVPSGDRLARTIAKLKWPFEQDEIKRLNGNLQRFVQTFSFALTVQGLTTLGKTSDSAEAALREGQKAVQTMIEMSKQFGIPAAEQERMSAQLDHILDLLPSLGQQAVEIKESNQYLQLAEAREQARQKAEVLEWLLPAASLQRHVKTQQQRTERTCQWFLQSRDFKQWEDCSQPAHDILCTGNPGVGKTVLTSFVVDHLRTKARSEDPVILSYYFTHFEESSQNPVYFIRSLMRQICQILPRLPASVVEFYQRTRHQIEDILWSQELQSLLERIISTCDHVFIVLDALDEIEDVRQRNAVLATLKTVRSTNPGVRLFATARPHLLDLHSRFILPTMIGISAQQADIELMLTEKLEEHPDFELFEDSALRAEVIAKLCSSSSGNFLLPALQLDHILEQVSKAEVRLALSNLSQTLEDAFKASFARINARSPARRNLALRTMMWISHARRPLLLVELQHALAVKEENRGSDLDKDNVISPRVLLESCSGLVQVHDEVITFVHSSLDEYLLSKASDLLTETVGNCEANIARTCLTYLLQPILKRMSSMSTDNFVKTAKELPLLRYAAYTWGIHARNLKLEDYTDLTMALFNSGMSLITISRVMEMDLPYARKWETEAVSWAYSDGAGIIIAANFGLPELVKHLLVSVKDVSVINKCRSRYGNTALQDAAGWGHTAVCQILIAYGADPMDRNKAGATAFYQAVACQQLETARVLLEHHRGQLDTRCRDGATPLHKAAEMGDKEMVTFLLSSGALFAVQNEALMTPLHLAANRGHVEIVQLLVLAGADINVMSHTTKYTPLCLASTCGHADVIRYLLSQGGLVNNKGADSWTPLFRASRGGHAASVTILLESGANLLHLDFYKNTCLHNAARSGNLTVVKALLDHNPVTRSQLLGKRDGQRRTALQIALTTANIDVYKYLRDLQHGIDAKIGNEARVYDPVIPLAMAIEAGSLTVVRQMIEKEPELLHRADASAQLPIHVAFVECAVDIAGFLLNAGASIHSQGFHSWQPIHIAASLGSLDMVDLALTHGAYVNGLTGTLQTPLLKAASAGNLAVIRRLLEAGADPWARNDRDMTCLHVMASKNFIEGIREILLPKWNAQGLIHLRDRQRRLPRYWAQRSGHYETVTFLRLQEKLIGNSSGRSKSFIQSPPQTSRTNSTVGFSGSASQLTPSRTPTNLLDSEDVLAHMVLDLDSD